MDRVLVFDTTLRDGEQVSEKLEMARQPFDDDLISIVKDDIAQVPETYTLDYRHSISGTYLNPVNRLVHPTKGRGVQEVGP